MAEQMTEREQFYYGKGYADGRIALLKEINEELETVDEYLYGDDWSNGYNTAIDNVINVINKVVGDSDGRE